MFPDADCNDDDMESTPEQVARRNVPSGVMTSEPVPSTSSAEQPQTQEHGDVLQSGEAVLAEKWCHNRQEEGIADSRRRASI